MPGPATAAPVITGEPLVHNPVPRNLPEMNSPSRSIRAEDSAPGLAMLDAALVLYLVLPVLLFCAWFKPPLAIGLAALLSYALLNTLAGVRLRESGVRPAAIGAIAVVALAWTAVAGVGHFFYANLDWVTRDAVLRDLTATAWPPMYDGGGDFSLILRAPIGYYLPAALVGWLAGPAVGDFALYLWDRARLRLVPGRGRQPLRDPAPTRDGRDPDDRLRWHDLVNGCCFAATGPPGTPISNGGPRSRNTRPIPRCCSGCPTTRCRPGSERC